jgi:autotransporter-associated beta strand protein
MKKLLLSLTTAILLLNPTNIFAQLYWIGTPVNSWNSSNWSTTGSVPFSSPWVANSAAVFNVENSLITGATVAFSSITANENVTFTSISGTIGTGGTVANINVASGKLFDFGTQAISTASGTGFVKDGAGSLSLGGGTYSGGFTLNSGTVILRGANAMGAGGTLTINGGTIAGSATRDLTGKYTSITVGGNFTLGSSVSPAASSASLTFNAPINLGANDRVITLDGTGGTRTLAGVISSTGGGLTIESSTAGLKQLTLSGSNTYTGPTVITGVNSRLALGASEVIPNNSPITLNGGEILTSAFSETYSTLRLTENSNIILNGSSVQNHNFSASNLISWTAGKTLTISGWLGTFNGTTTGTAGRIFIGSDATGLTLAQLSQIKFFNGSTNSDAAILSTGEIVPTGTLPISLTSFIGKAVDKSVLLNWATASETNNDYFEVLKSSNGKTFTAIGTVKGNGTTSDAKSYSFVDVNPAAGTNYYQLIQHDFDGKSSKSDIIPVNSAISSSSLTVYAAASSVNVSINSANQTNGTLQVFDLAGKKLNETRLTLNKGFNTTSIPLSLNSGIYVVSFVSEAEVINSKFIKD